MNYENIKRLLEKYSINFSVSRTYDLIDTVTIKYPADAPKDYEFHTQINLTYYQFLNESEVLMYLTKKCLSYAAGNTQDVPAFELALNELCNLSEN